MNQEKLMKFVVYWLPLIIWAFIMFGFSSQPYEQQDLRPFIQKHIDEQKAEQLLNNVKINYNDKEISVKTKGVAGFIEFFIRKGAHLFEYTVLGILLYRAIQSTGISTAKTIALSLALSFLYASSDEWHQSFSINRTPLLDDVIIDFAGASLGIMMALF